MLGWDLLLNLKHISATVDAWIYETCVHHLTCVILRILLVKFLVKNLELCALKTVSCHSIKLLILSTVECQFMALIKHMIRELDLLDLPCIV